MEATTPTTPTTPTTTTPAPASVRAPAFRSVADIDEAKSLARSYFHEAGLLRVTTIEPMPKSARRALDEFRGVPRFPLLRLAAILAIAALATAGAVWSLV